MNPSYARLLTWIVASCRTGNGKQGFQTPIEPESFVVDNMGVYGNYHTERNLTCELTIVLAFNLADGLLP